MSRGHLLEPPLGPDFPWATGEILGRNTEEDEMRVMAGPGQGVGLQAGSEEGRGQRRTSETREGVRAHGSKQAEDRGLLSAWVHVFKDSSPSLLLCPE